MFSIFTIVWKESYYNVFVSWLMMYTLNVFNIMIETNSIEQ